MKNHYLYLLFIFILLGCSKDELSSIDETDNTKLSLTISNTNSYSVSFKYSYGTNLENVKLVWNNTDLVDLNNKIGESNIILNNSSSVINNLEQNQIYFFRLIGESNNKKYYSDIVSTTTSEIEITFDNKLFQNETDIITHAIVKVIKTMNGYIIATNAGQFYSDNTTIRVIMVDNQFNLLWNFKIDESPYSDELAGILELDDGSFIGIARKYESYSILNENDPDHQVYGFKFTSNGELLWIKSLNASNSISNYTIPFENNSNTSKVIFSADTTNNNNPFDFFYREIEMNNDGQIIVEKIINNVSPGKFWNIKYDENGNKFNYGNIDIQPDDILSTWDAMLEKYDINNKLIWANSYGYYGPDDSADNILIDNESIIIIGKKGHQNRFDGESRWLIQTDSNGTVKWDIQKTREYFIYQGKDIIKDSDGNYLSLFFDIYYPNAPVYDLATVIKTNSEGNVLWEFSDGLDFNTDKFQPYKIIQDDNSYLIFGNKEGKIWLKQFKMK